MSPLLPVKLSVSASTPTPSGQETSKPHDRTHSTASTHRSSSISSWVKNLFPSNRPERRGTLRHQGYWEQHKSTRPNNNESHRPGRARRSRRSTTAGSNQITEWNMARELSDHESICHVQDEGAPIGGDKKWSWVTGDDASHGQVESFDKKMEQEGSVVMSHDRTNMTSANSSGSHTISTTDRQLIEAKKESRQHRRNLKESGDYLGIQGFNPETGQLDIVTPTDSDRSSLSQETQRKLLVLRNTLKHARHSYKSAKEKSEVETRQILLKHERGKLHRLEKEKHEVGNIDKTVRWKRHKRQWSSAQEPDLSPIAQSLVEMGENPRLYSISLVSVMELTGVYLASAGRSQNHVLKARPRDSLPSLIDIDTSDKPQVSSSNWQGNQLLGESPQSAVTVVQTPHRQSLEDQAELAPSAWELFVNGISFDISDESMPARDVESDMTATATKCTRPSEYNRGHDDCKSSYEPGCETPPLNCSAGTEKNDQGDFLAMRPQRQDGLGVRTGAKDTYAKLSAKTKKVSFFHDKNLKMSKKHKQDPVEPSIMNRNYGGAASASSITTAMDQPMQISRPKGTLHPKEIITKLPNSPQRILRNWGPWMSKRRGPRSSRSGQDDTVHTRELRLSQETQSVPDLGVIPSIPETWGADLESRVGQKISVHRSDPDLRRIANRQGGLRADRKPHQPVSIAKMDSLTSGLDKKRTETINTLLQPALARYASTRITTTTGCGQQGLQVSSLANIKRKTPSSGPPLLDKDLTRIVSDPRLASKSEHNSEGYAMKPLQNTLPSMDQADSGTGPDTMSRQIQMSANRGIAGSTMPFRVVGSRTARPLSAGKPAKLTGNAAAESGFRELGVHGIDERPKPGAEARNAWETNPANMDTELIVRGEDQFVTQRRVHDWLSNTMAVSGNPMAVPGSFPDPNLGIVSADGDQGLSSDGSTVNRNFHDATDEFLRMVRCHIIESFLLYWDIVSPIFDSRSEFWERNKRYESTLADCLALILALPGALVAIVGLV